MVEAAQQLAGPGREQPRGGHRVAAGERLFDAAAPHRHGHPATGDAHAVDVGGLSGQQQAVGVAGEVGAAQGGERQRGGRVAACVLARVQPRRRGDPGAAVSAHVVDEPHGSDAVEQPEQGAAQRPRQRGKAGPVEQGGVAAGMYGEHAQHVCGGVDQCGRALDGAVGGGRGEQPGQQAGLGLPAGHPVRQPRQVGARLQRQDGGQVVGVGRRQRRGTGEQPGELGAQVGVRVAAEMQDAQPLRRRGVAARRPPPGGSRNGSPG
jgi:hypothetical protein